MCILTQEMVQLAFFKHHNAEKNHYMANSDHLDTCFIKSKLTSQGLVDHRRNPLPYTDHIDA